MITRLSAQIESVPRLAFAGSDRGGAPGRFSAVEHHSPLQHAAKEWKRVFNAGVCISHKCRPVPAHRASRAWHACPGLKRPSQKLGRAFDYAGRIECPLAQPMVLEMAKNRPLTSLMRVHVTKLLAITKRQLRQACLGIQRSTEVAALSVMRLDRR